MYARRFADSRTSNSVALGTPSSTRTVLLLPPACVPAGRGVMFDSSSEPSNYRNYLRFASIRQQKRSHSIVVKSPPASRTQRLPFSHFGRSRVQNTPNTPDDRSTVKSCRKHVIHKICRMFAKHFLSVRSFVDVWRTLGCFWLFRRFCRMFGEHFGNTGEQPCCLARKAHRSWP